MLLSARCWPAVSVKCRKDYGGRTAQHGAVLSSISLSKVMASRFSNGFVV
jgi:hypothetical protein